MLKKKQTGGNLKNSISKILTKDIPEGRDTVFVKYKIPLMNMRKEKQKEKQQREEEKKREGGKVVRQRKVPNHQKDFVYERELKLIVGKELVQLFAKQMEREKGAGR